MTALDTSVCVAALLEWHDLHEPCAAAADGARIPAHALVETYSVLTRLPPPHRVGRGPVSELLQRRFGASKVLTAPPALQRRLVDRMSAAGIDGGAAYDGVVALTASEHGERLLTCDARAVRTYERLGVDFQLVGVLG